MAKTDYHYIRPLGKGAFGSVVLARDEKGKQVAIKQNAVHSSTSGIGSLREVALWKLSSHPFVVELRDIVYENPLSRRLIICPSTGMKEDKSYLVMERGDKSLARYSFQNESDLQQFLTCILLAIESMHLKDIIHRDIRPENMLKIGKIYKLCDLGLASVYSELDFKTVPTSNHYMPPEIAQNMPTGHPVDIWAIAVVTLELLFGKSFLNVSMKTPRVSIWTNIRNQLKQLHDWLDHPWISEPLRKMLEGMLEIDPNDRWTATQCLNSRFFDTVRNYVQEIRTSSSHRPSFSPSGSSLRPSGLSLISSPSSTEIFASPEAKVGLEVFRHFWKEKYSWCSTRMLVHGLVIYSRYLKLQNNNVTSLNAPTDSTDMKGWEIRAFAIIYMSVKMWSGEFASAFSEITFPDLVSVDLEETYIQFERQLCESLEWELYVPTVFETSSDWNQVTSYLTSVLH